jgi:hypothetical protein
MIRSLRDENAKGLRTSVIRSLNRISVKSPEGIYLGEATGLKLDMKRIHAMAERMVKGLYAKFYKSRLPESHRVHIFLTELQKDLTALESPELKEIIGFLAEEPWHHRGAGVLRLKCVAAGEDSYSSVWFVRIVEAFSFFALTLPIESNKA